MNLLPFVLSEENKMNWITFLFISLPLFILACVASAFAIDDLYTVIILGTSFKRRIK